MPALGIQANDNTINFALQLKAMPEADEYAIDFNRVNRIDPFALLFLSSEIERCRSARKTAKFTAKNVSSMRYAAHMGFFKAFGCEYGESPRSTSGGFRYLPITIMNVRVLRSKAQIAAKRVEEIVEEEAEKLARILARADKGMLYEALAYSMREMIRNVVEHSEADQLGYCAQYWPSMNKVQIAFLDRGVGIRRTLSCNPLLQISSDHDALNLASMPGISGKAYKSQKQDTYDMWQHSGYGLYMTSRLCREGGSFFIASGDTSLLIHESSKRYIDAPFIGTALRLELRSDLTGRLADLLATFRREGDSFARKYCGRECITASLASMMLLKDTYE
jgi:hypothetical protein